MSAKKNETFYNKLNSNGNITQSAKENWQSKKKLKNMGIIINRINQFNINIKIDGRYNGFDIHI